MGLWSKEQLRAFIKENNLVTAQDAQNALKDLFAETPCRRCSRPRWTRIWAMKSMTCRTSKREIAATGRARRQSRASTASKK